MGFDERDVGVADVALAVVGEILGECRPASDIVPIEGALDHEDAARFFQNGVVYRDFRERRENVREELCKVFAAVDARDECAQLGRVPLERGEDGGDRPDEHAGVPPEVALPEKLLGQLGVRFFAEARHVMHSGAIFRLGDGERTAHLDVAKSGTCPSRLDADSHELPRLSSGGGGGAEGLLKPSDIADEMIGRQHNHRRLRIARRDPTDAERDGRSGVALGGLGDDVLRRQSRGEFAHASLLVGVG